MDESTAQTLRRLLAHHPLAGSETTTPVYAVDVSVWDRCDAECSAERGYYYHPSRHSAGQPIVSGSGPTSSSPSSISFARAGWPPWTWSASASCAGGQRGGCSEQLKAFLCASRMRTSKSRSGPLRCSYSTPPLRSCEAPRALEGGASLLRRSEPRWPTRPHWQATSPRPKMKCKDPRTPGLNLPHSTPARTPLTER
jgi:hypothetical protein